MIERLEAIKKRYQELQELLSKPEIYNDINKMKEVSKESSDLEITVNRYERNGQGP